MPKQRCSVLVEQSQFDNLGVGYLTAVLKRQGHPTQVVFDDYGFKPWSWGAGSKLDSAKLLEHLRDNPTDVLLVSVNSDFYQRALALARAVKERYPAIVICFGGVHATHAHTHVLKNSCIDYVCRGEGEIAVLDLLAHLENPGPQLPQGIYRVEGGQIRGSGLGRLVEDLDSLPFPDKADFYAKVPHASNIYTVITGRGCYSNCSYCNSSSIRRQYREMGHRFMRRRSVDNVLKELHFAKKTYNPKYIMVYDDTFIYDKKFLRVFAERYRREIHLPFYCETNPNFFDEEILRLLVDAGLCFTEVGVQSLDPWIRQNIFHRSESIHNVGKFVSLLKKLGVFVSVDHIINPWDQHRQRLKDQAARYNQFRPPWISVFYLQYYPGTKIIEYARRDGFLDDQDVDNIYNGIIPKNYFFGGSVQRERLSSFKDVSLVLTILPAIPPKVAASMIRSDSLKVCRFLPRQTVLVGRALNALLRRGDFNGRNFLKYFLVSLLPFRRGRRRTGQGGEAPAPGQGGQ
ncbi:MAG: radical SAM protein [Pseudomonadota bacterium]